MCKVSIIVPIYNSEKTLNRCLNSIQEQTFNDFEVLLINDGSTDASLEICKSYCDKDKRFAVYSQENAGVSAARNKGMDISSGDYIYFIDADDYISNDAIEKLYKAAVNTDADVTVCGFSYVIEGITIPESEKSLKPGIYNETQCEEIALSILSNTAKRICIEVFSGLRLTKRDVFENPKHRFLEKLHRSEDVLFWTELHFRIKKLCSINDQKLYYYVDTESSATNNYIDDYWLSLKRIVKILSNKLPSSEEVNQGLKIMLMYRSRIALNNAARAKDIDTFNSSVSEILSDKDLQQAIYSLEISKGYDLFGPYYLLMRLRLKKIISYRYYNKFRGNNKIQ